MSLQNSVMLIEAIFLNVLVIRDGWQGIDTGSLKSIAEWSDIRGSRTMRSDSLSAVRVISKPSVWPESCVGECTCCLRSKVSSRVEKEVEKWSVAMSTWMLKSPSMIRSAGEEAMLSRSSAKSERNWIVKKMEGDKAREFDTISKDEWIWASYIQMIRK